MACVLVVRFFVSLKQMPVGNCPSCRMVFTKERGQNALVPLFFDLNPIQSLMIPPKVAALSSGSEDPITDALHLHVRALQSQLGAQDKKFEQLQRDRNSAVQERDELSQLAALHVNRLQDLERVVAAAQLREFEFTASVTQKIAAAQKAEDKCRRMDDEIIRLREQLAEASDRCLKLKTFQAMERTDGEVASLARYMRVCMYVRMYVCMY